MIPTDFPGYIAQIKAALNSALQFKAKNAEFVTLHTAGLFDGRHQFCARCKKVIATIGETEPFSFTTGVVVFENCLGEMDTNPRTLFRIPCQLPVIEQMDLACAKRTFVK